ncbi:hypothetical protein [Nocardia flavorosea]|uniref:Uncharacterized protein n=1 Tax=Nocardia flavorosea TaxID=53429 RepID=A0A846YQ42_9NOCA|nr:hypothetical protein [Nocardia flavorosea]NKY59831.1 hypothetical protein [Nocardia flavorosea]
MATAYFGDPADVIAAATEGYGLHGELEGYLSSWMGLKDDYQAAVNGNETGKQIQLTMQAAYDSGKRLAGTMQQILDTLKETGVKVDGMDLEMAAQIKFDDAIAANDLGSNTQSLGTNGKLDLNAF